MESGSDRFDPHIPVTLNLFPDYGWCKWRFDERPPLPWGEDTKPYERSELGGVGEGLCPVDRTDPLTQLQLGNKLPSLRNPLPMGEGVHAETAKFAEVGNTLTRFG